MDILAMQQGANASVLNATYMHAVSQALAEFKSATAPSPKHQEWFHGRVVPSHENGDMERRVAARVAERMKERLSAIGEANYSQFQRKMAPLQHAMRKSVAASLIPGHITHGVCRFGETVQKFKDRFEVVRFCVANGEVEIDTEKDDRYLTLVDRTRERFTYYGVAQVFDRCGNLVGFNKDMGENGLMFVTDDKREALFNVAAISTGRTVREMQEIATPPARPVVAGPRF